MRFALFVLGITYVRGILFHSSMRAGLVVPHWIAEDIGHSLRPCLTWKHRPALVPVISFFMAGRRGIIFGVSSEENVLVFKECVTREQQYNGEERLGSPVARPHLSWYCLYRVISLCLLL